MSDKRSGRLPESDVRPRSCYTHAFMVAILLTLVAIAAGVAIMRAFIRSGDGEDLSVWTLLGILFGARLVSRVVPWLMPDVDVMTRLSATMGVYMLAIAVALVFWAKLSVLRSLVCAIAASLVMLALMVVAVSYLPKQ